MIKKYLDSVAAAMVDSLLFDAAEFRSWFSDRYSINQSTWTLARSSFHSKSAETKVLVKTSVVYTSFKICEIILFNEKVSEF